ncbi:MAG: YihY/virulence factor BrkB family protein, partial [Actinomycetota bacterium]|nr:YihY/virulence factor BrkB family protein [Actinomycetota bacterium]
PGPAQEIATNTIETISESQSSAGFALILGLAGAIYSASGYVGAFSRASNAIWEVEEGRPFWKLKPWQILITTAMLLMLSVCALAVFVTGPVAEEVGNVIGAGDVALTVWAIAKWPVIALVVAMLFAFLYWSAPNVEQPKFRWITPGGILAVVVWLAASGLFALYVATFASYNATYGALAGVVVFLVWLWITNIAMLLGAELNAEVERGRELEAGIPMKDTIALPPREPAKEDDEEAPDQEARNRRSEASGR